MIKEFGKNNQLIDHIRGQEIFTFSVSVFALIGVVTNFVCWWLFSNCPWIKNEFLFGIFTSLAFMALYLGAKAVMKHRTPKAVIGDVSMLFGIIAILQPAGALLRFTYRCSEIEAQIKNSSLYDVFRINGYTDIYKEKYSQQGAEIIGEGTRLIVTWSFIIVILLGVVLVGVAYYLAERNERIIRNLSQSKLYVTTDRITGVSYENPADDKTQFKFDIALDDIDEVTYRELKIPRSPYVFINPVKGFNICIRLKNSDAVAMSLNFPQDANSELKYVLGEVRSGFKPYPRRICKECGWFMKGEKCPHCGNTEYTFHKE